MVFKSFLQRYVPILSKMDPIALSAKAELSHVICCHSGPLTAMYAEPVMMFVQPTPCYSRPLICKCFPRNRVLKRPEFVFLASCKGRV
jgi:hypothetical protein